MMATTHALAGLVLASVTLGFAPELAPVAFAAGFVGGLFPDMDLYAGHRRTLHFPFYYAMVAMPAFLLAAFHPSAVTVGLAFFLVAAAFHSATDAFGGGLELRPWQGTSDRGVYDHYRDRWLPPRRWVRYDGAPEDLLLAIILGMVAFPLVSGPMETVVLLALAVSAVYAALRKRFVTVAERVVARTPRGVLAYVPDRFIGDLR